jgi:hypothetical protein
MREVRHVRFLEIEAGNTRLSRLVTHAKEPPQSSTCRMLAVWILAKKHVFLRDAFAATKRNVKP